MPDPIKKEYNPSSDALDRAINTTLGGGAADYTINTEYNHGKSTYYEDTGLWKHAYDDPTRSVFNDRADIDAARARNQGFFSELLTVGANLIADIPMGIVQNVGHIGAGIGGGVGELLGVVDPGTTMEMQKDIQETFEAVHNPFGKLHRANPNATWDLGDSAWYMQQFSGLLESIGEFAVTGAGVGKLLGSGFRAMGQAYANSKKIANLMQANKVGKGINYAIMK